MNPTPSEILDIQSKDFPFIDQPIKVYTLKNGHKIIIANKKGELVNVSTWVRTGSINEDDSNTGISHFLEHLMFKGTPAHPAGEFDRILEAKGAIVNAATWKDYTFYYVTLPKGENDEHFLNALDLHADMMLNAALPESEIGPVFDFSNPNVTEKRERYVVIEEIRMRKDQPWTKTYNALNKLMYNIHPYKRDVIGTPEVISSVPQKVIMDYYKNWYRPENFVTIIVGDVDADRTADLVREKFAFEGTADYKQPVYSMESAQTEPQYVEASTNINTGFLILGFHTASSKDLKGTIGIDMLSLILGEGKSSRLNQNLIEKPASPVFNVVGSVHYQFKDGNTMFLQGNFKPAQKDEAIQQIRNEVQKIVENPVSEEELTKAKKKLKARFAAGFETVSEIGETLGHYMIVCNDLSYYSDYLKILDSITVEDISALCREYLDLNKSNLSVLMPE